MHCLEPGCTGRLRVVCTSEAAQGRVRRSRRCELCNASLTTDELAVPRQSKAVKEATRATVLIALTRGIRPSVISRRYSVSGKFVRSMRLQLADIIAEDTRLADAEFSPTPAAPASS